MADETQIMEALRNADKAGDTAAATRLAALLKGSSTTRHGAGGGWGRGAGGEWDDDPQAGRDFRMREGVEGFEEGVKESLGGIATVAEHPIEAAKAIPGAVTKGVGKLTKAASQPGQTVKDIVNYFKNLDARQVAKLAGTGVTGAGAGKALSSLGELVGPSVKALLPKKAPVSPAVRRLADEGVVMTPGQRAGGWKGAVEEKAAKIIPPVIGRARNKAVEQWNTARLNEALRAANAPEVPKGMTGRDALRHTYQALQDRYRTVLGQMGGDLNRSLGGNPSLASDLAQLKSKATQNVDLGKAGRRIVNDTIDKEVTAKFPGSGKATGDTMQKIVETLRTQADKYEKSGAPRDRAIAAHLRDARTAVENMLDRENPKLAVERKAINEGYAKYKLSAKATNYAATKSGAYTPGQRLQAIKARDVSKDKNRFATGEAMGQTEAEEAQGILGNTQPDSGTPAGLALMELLMGGAGAAAGHPVAAGALMASPAIYSQPVLKWLQDRALRQGAASPSKLPYVAGIGATQFHGTDEAGVVR